MTIMIVIIIMHDMTWHDVAILSSDPRLHMNMYISYLLECSREKADVVWLENVVDPTM